MKRASPLRVGPLHVEPDPSGTRQSHPGYRRRMALKAQLWFLGKCLDEERKRSNLAHLSSRALDLGLKKTDSTRGHVFQAIGALQNFYGDNASVAAHAKAGTVYEPYEFTGADLARWKTWFAAKSATNPPTYGRGSWGYNYYTLDGYLTAKYGGRRTGGGGGDNEFEIVARLLAEFI